MMMQAIAGKQAITAVILAGGRGSRLDGQDKGLVAFQEKPLIEHVLARLRPQVSTCLINANRHLTQYQQYHYPVITDGNKDYLGPLAGMLSGLQHCKTEWLLSVPCDSPFLPLNLTDTFIQAHNKHHHTAYVASIDNRIQPVFSLLHLSLIPKIQAFLQAKDYKVGYFMRQQTAITVNFSEQKDCFININNIADIQFASKLALAND